MQVHLVEGAEGCQFARECGGVAVIVDALRASATAAMLLDAGATEILAVRTVEEAFEARAELPDALLYGERGGLPPEGFDHGNSPAEAGAARGRRVVFTTTTGAGRLVEAWGAAAVMMGSPVNGSAAARHAAALAAAAGTDVVVVPAGLMDEPDHDAQEDRAASVFLARLILETPGATPGRGEPMLRHFGARLASEGLAALFHGAPHAENLRRINKTADIDLCARVDATRSVPLATARHPLGVVMRAAAATGERA